MKKLMGAGTAILVLLALVGCSSISEGTVHDKRHTEGYYYTTYTCAGYNAQGVCSVQVPIMQYVGPSWALDLYQSEEEHGWRSVTESTYENYDVGDYYKAEE